MPLVFLFFVDELDGPVVSARHAIAEAKQCPQRSITGWVTKIYYLELLRASEGTLSRWFWLQLVVVSIHSSFKEG
jgi:hypothetical protein